MSDRSTSTLPLRPSRVVVLGVLGVCALLSTGCYHRVIGAKGLGADNYNISEPYQESGQLDEWIFGSPGPSSRPINNTKLPQ